MARTSSGGAGGERHPQRLAGVGIAPLRVGVVGAPHELVDAHVVDQRGLARAQEAGADPEVSTEVLTRPHGQVGGYRAEEPGFGAAARRHAGVEPVERVQATGQPGDALLRQCQAETGMAFEHSAEDQVPQGSVGEPGKLDQHDRPRRLQIAVVGDPAPAVDIERDVSLLAQLPQRLVVGVPQRPEVRVGRDGGQEDPAEHVHLVVRPADLGDGVVDAVEEHLHDAGATIGRVGAEVDQPPVVRLQPGPPAVVLVLGRRERHQVALLEERGNGVREQHLRGDPVGVELGQPALAVPVAVGRGGQQIAERVRVAGRPPVELVVPGRGQIRPVVEQVGAGVAVRGDDGVALGQLGAGAHEVSPFRSGRGEEARPWRWRRRERGATTRPRRGCGR